MWFTNFNCKINPTGNLLFSMGWFVINIYTTFYLLYKKSILCATVDTFYNFFVPSTHIEYVPNADNCEFVVYTFDKIRKRIARYGQPLFEEKYRPLKESPFLSTEILVTSSDGKSVTSHSVEFRTDRYDYYVEGNIFHTKFITYFLQKHYYVNIFGCDYSIHAIDRKTFDTLVFLKGDTPIKITEKS